jgi:hypothetical protein
MLRTIALLLSFQANQGPNCNPAELVLANADVSVAQTLVSQAGKPKELRIARAYLKAARERRRAAAALCTAARIPRKHNPFWLDDQPDPFDLARGSDGESAFSDEAFFRAVLEYSADFGPKVAP